MKKRSRSHGDQKIIIWLYLLVRCSAAFSSAAWQADAIAPVFSIDVESRLTPMTTNMQEPQSKKKEMTQLETWAWRVVGMVLGVILINWLFGPA